MGSAGSAELLLQHDCRVQRHSRIWKLQFSDPSNVLKGGVATMVNRSRAALRPSRTGPRRRTRTRADTAGRRSTPAPCGDA
jgi:hypothetical protein